MQNAKLKPNKSQNGLPVQDQTCYLQAFIPFTLSQSTHENLADRVSPTSLWLLNQIIYGRINIK